MKLSNDTVIAILSRFMDEGIVTDYASEYGEPGYSYSDALSDDDTPMVMLGDYWCHCGKVLHPEGHPSEGQPALHEYSYHRPKLWEQLHDQGVEFHWYDEWIVDHEHDKAYRTQPNSYSWQPSYVLTDDGEMLTPDDDDDAWIEWALNDPNRCLLSTVFTEQRILDAGFTRHNGVFENGWHPGQTDDPRQITEAICEQYAEHGDVDVVFFLNGVGQFDARFSAYYRLPEADEDAAEDAA